MVRQRYAPPRSLLSAKQHYYCQTASCDYYMKTHTTINTTVVWYQIGISVK